MVHSQKFSKLELMQGRVDFVPDGWEFVHLEKALKIRNNLRLPISDDERQKNPGPYPYYGPTKIQGYIGTYQQDGSFALIGEDGDHFLKYRTQPMTQLVDGKCTVNNHAHIIEGTRKATREWFYYYFMHRDIFSFLTRQGAGRYKLNKAALEKLPILVPPIEEQKKIANIISIWDKAIAMVENLITNSQQQKNGLMQQLLTGKKRISFKDDSYKLKKTRYGSIPDEWSYPQIKEICSSYSKKNTDQNDYPVLSCSKHEGFVDSLKYFKKKVFSDDTSGYKIIPKGYFGFPSNHIEEGSIGLQNIYDKGIVSPIYVVFGTDQSRVNNDYLFALLKTEHYRQIFSAMTNASVDRRGSLRWNEFSSIHVPLPPLEEQNKIAEVILEAEKVVESYKLQLNALVQEKKSLMQQLLTGKRRVA